jgi:hypothetical protein
MPIDDEVQAVVRRKADGEEWVDLETVRAHVDGVRIARERADSVRDRNWTKDNPSARIGTFRLVEIR